ncbi:MAG: helix-turn-helix domain-containing protein [Polyangia bacterium]
MSPDDLFTAPQVAKICSTDLKTIHNWVNRGEIRFFRTPGRHLRFRREDIVDFLQRFGYPVPEGFAPAPAAAVVIDGDDGRRRSLSRSLGKELSVMAFSDYVDALLAIGRERPALVMINGAEGPEVLRAAERIAQSESPPRIAVYGEEKLPDSLSGNGAVQRIEGYDTRSIRRSVGEMLS